MDQVEKFERVATILIEKYGNRAKGVAQRRAHNRITNDDYETAVVWARVAEAAIRLLLASEVRAQQH
jgi:hypothetical protein